MFFLTVFGSPSERFWDWFSRNADQISKRISDAATNDASIAVAQDVADQLHKYDDRLFPLVGPGDDGVDELIVSAEGNTAAFNSVFELMKAAPTLKGWRLIALKPRQRKVNVDHAIAMDGQQLAIESTRFSVTANGDQYDLTILVPDHDKTVEGTHFQMAVLLVEYILGEYDLAMRVAALDVIPLSEFQDTGGHIGRPLVEILDAIPQSQPQ